MKLDEDLARLRAALAELDQSLHTFESPPRTTIPIDVGLEPLEALQPPPVTTRLVPAIPAESSTPTVGHEILRMPTVREQPGPPPSLEQSSNRRGRTTGRRFAIAAVMVSIGVGTLVWWRLTAPTSQAPAPPATPTPAPGVREIPVAAPEAATPAVAAPVEVLVAKPAGSSTVVERTLPASHGPDPAPLKTETMPQPNNATMTLGRPASVEAVPLGRPASVEAVPLGRPASVEAVPLGRPGPLSEPTVTPEAGVGAALGPLAPAPVAPREEPEIALPPPPQTTPAISPSAPAPNPAFDEATAVEQLRQVVGQYELAYDRLDAQAAAAVWPSVDAPALARAFAALTQQDLELHNCTFRVLTTVATAECVGALRYVRRIGSSALRTEQRSWTIRFERAGEQWRIVTVTAR